MELSGCTVLALSVFGLMLALPTWMAISSYLDSKRWLSKQLRANKVETKKKNWLTVVDRAPQYVTAAALLIALGWLSTSITVVPCGKGEMAEIGRPVEKIVEMVGCGCCGDHLVAEAK